MAFFTRSSGSGKGRNRERYKTFHVQLKLWEGWLREVYFPFNEGGPFVAQAWKARSANSRIIALLRANADEGNSVTAQHIETENKNDITNIFKSKHVVSFIILI